MTNTPDPEAEPGDEAYLSFGGWAKLMPAPPDLHDRRRYVVDVECTGRATTSTDKGERRTRKLSILRVSEVEGVVVPLADENENQAALFDADGDGNVVEGAFPNHGVGGDE